MATAPVSSTDPSAAILSALNTSRDKEDPAQADLQNRFLTLLTAQIRNQDPLNPLDNNQMTSQLAQISTVDGIERLNTTLQTLMSSSSETSVLQSAALVGHGVLVPGKGLKLADGMALGGVELAAPAERVRVTVKDANGIAVRSFDLDDTTAGSHVFQWDGKTDAGAAAADGDYSFSVEAVSGADKVSATALELGVVTSVARSGSSVSLNVGTLGAYKLDDIRQII